MPIPRVTVIDQTGDRLAASSPWLKPLPRCDGMTTGHWRRRRMNARSYVGSALELPSKRLLPR
jgi:hypothetical protein